MQRIGLFLTICLCILAVSGCIGREQETSYSLAIRNYGPSEIALKKVAVNNKDYLHQALTLPAPTAKADGGEYWMVFTAGGTVKVAVVLEDKASGREFGFEHKFIDNAGEGYVITADYTGNGEAVFAANPVGRLSVWGGK